MTWSLQISRHNQGYYTINSNLHFMHNISPLISATTFSGSTFDFFEMELANILAQEPQRA